MITLASFFKKIDVFHLTTFDFSTSVFGTSTISLHQSSSLGESSATFDASISVAARLGWCLNSRSGASESGTIGEEARNRWCGWGWEWCSRLRRELEVVVVVVVAVVPEAKVWEAMTLFRDGDLVAWVFSLATVIPTKDLAQLRRIWGVMIR